MPDLVKVTDSMGDHLNYGGVNIWPPLGTRTDWIVPMIAGRGPWRFDTLDAAAWHVRAYLARDTRPRRPKEG